MGSGVLDKSVYSHLGTVQPALDAKVAASCDTMACSSWIARNARAAKLNGLMIPALKLPCTIRVYGLGLRN